MKQANSRWEIDETETADLPTTYIGCTVSTATAQTITTAIDTKLIFAAETTDDSDSMWDTTNNRIVIQTTGSGIWEIIATARWVASNSNALLYLSVYENGVYGGRQTSGACIATADGSGIAASSGTFYGIFGGEVGDYYELFVRQNTGGNLDCSRAKFSVRMLK